MALPVWMDIAFKEWGVKAIEPGSNPEILKYWQVAYPAIHDDDIPWCAAFLSWVMVQAQINLINPLPAAWKTMANPSECLPGAIAISKNATGNTGHATLVVTTKGTRFLGLGGNQQQEVDMDWFNIADFVFRMP